MWSTRLRCSGHLTRSITSEHEAAFTFRSRVIKTLQKSSQNHIKSSFLTCAQRIGAFLISLPPWITLDQSIMSRYHVLLAALKPAQYSESDEFLNKAAEKREIISKPPNKTTQPKKRHQRASSLSTTIQDPGRLIEKARRASMIIPRQPLSPTSPASLDGPYLIQQLKDCLEVRIIVQTTVFIYHLFEGLFHGLSRGRSGGICMQQFVSASRATIGVTGSPRTSRRSP